MSNGFESVDQISNKSEGLNWWCNRQLDKCDHHARMGTHQYVESWHNRVAIMGLYGFMKKLISKKSL